MSNVLLDIGYDLEKMDRFICHALSSLHEERSCKVDYFYDCEDYLDYCRESIIYFNHSDYVSDIRVAIPVIDVEDYV